MKPLFYSVALLSMIGFLPIHVQAKHIKQFSTTKFNYTLPTNLAKKCRSKKSCPTIDIRLIKTDKAWLDTLVNEAITDSKAPNYTRLRNELNEFVKDAVENYQTGSACNYTYTIRPKTLPDHKQVAQFFGDHVQDFGCTHYPDYQQYVVIDTKTKKLLTTQNIIIKGQEKQFLQVLRASYHQLLIEYDFSAQDIINHEKDYPIETSDNFYFDKKEMVFQYDIGVLGPSVMIRPTLNIPYSALKGIVKAEYLP